MTRLSVAFRSAKGLLLLVVVALALPLHLHAEDWPQFRGANGKAVGQAENLPIKWSTTENVRWVADLPGRGLSSPVIFKGHVYLTANSAREQDRLHVLCYDLANGKKLWERQLWVTGSTACHPKTCMAAETMAADADGVYAKFGTGDMAAYDHDGRL